MAVDATDRLLLAHAATAIVTAGRGRVAVIDDRFGALTLGAAALLGCLPPTVGAGGEPHNEPGSGSPASSNQAGPLIRVHQDALTAETALAQNAAALGARGVYTAHRLDAELLAGARLVLAQLPRSLAALRDLAEHVARYSDPGVMLLAGGRVKHMTPAMNVVLGESFATVQASLAHGKSRVMVASGPRPHGLTYPISAKIPEVGLTVYSYGAAFAGASLDVGTRYLLTTLESSAEAPQEVRDVIDLGCGTGILATWAARRWPQAQVTATDRSQAAVDSAVLTAAANGVSDRLHPVRDDAGATSPAASADLVLLNPPFHDGAAIRTDTAHRMFASAGRALRPGGTLWCVWNSSLRYRPALERLIGHTEQIARNAKFTVTRSTRGR